MSIDDIPQTKGGSTWSVVPARIEKAPIEKSSPNVKPGDKGKTMQWKDGMDAPDGEERRQRALKVAGAAIPATTEAALQCGNKLEKYSPPPRPEGTAPYLYVDPAGFADVSSEQARGEFEKMRTMISKNMNIPEEKIVYSGWGVGFTQVGASARWVI